MSNSKKFKKLKKFFRDPNLFFYDMFRKRVFKDKLSVVEERTFAMESSSRFSIDLGELKALGLVKYVRNSLGAGVGVEDGIDESSLLIWSGHINLLIELIESIKNLLGMNLKVYTLGGGVNISIDAQSKLSVLDVTNKLKGRPDFIVELSNPLGELHVVHFYMYDIDADALATVRSSRAWIKRFKLEDLSYIYGGSANKEKPIDAVYTWVNHADPAWQKYWMETFPDESFDPDRYTSNDELRYSLRSLNKYAPWINKIYIVTNCSAPEWLLLEHPKIEWVWHEQVFPDITVLPSFNSHAIESCLHRIEGLSEQFIYLNDDFILGQPCLPSDFFDSTGRSMAYFEPYGMIESCRIKEGQPDYIVASKNSRRILIEALKYEARNLHRHVPYALKTSVMEELEIKFAKEFKSTREAKKRSDTDVNVTSFLYHHYAYANGRAVYADAPGLIVRPQNINTIISKDSVKYKFLCFNDGNGSASDGEYKALTMSFFDYRLSEKAGWEK